MRDANTLNELSDCHPAVGGNDPQPKPIRRLQAHRRGVAENNNVAWSNVRRHFFYSGIPPVLISYPHFSGCLYRTAASLYPGTAAALRISWLAPRITARALPPTIMPAGSPHRRRRRHMSKDTGKPRAVTVCKDCDRETLTDNDLLKAGWVWIALAEGDDACNGWRCPECVEGWRIIAEEVPNHGFGLN